MKIKKESYYIVRTLHAGVFFGRIAKLTADTVEMLDVRKIWKWHGAMTVDDMALYGIQANDSNVTVRVPQMLIADPIQVIECTRQACTTVDSIREWRVDG